MIRLESSSSMVSGIAGSAGRGSRATLVAGAKSGQRVQVAQARRMVRRVVRRTVRAGFLIGVGVMIGVILVGKPDAARSSGPTDLKPADRISALDVINAGIAPSTPSVQGSVRGAAAQLPAQPSARSAVVRVQAGDNLWSLAARYGDPDAPVSTTVEQMLEWNHLRPSAMLQPGELVRVRG